MASSPAESSSPTSTPSPKEGLLAAQINMEALSPTARLALGEVSEAWVYSIPLNVRFRGVTERQGLLVRGPAGWGEAAPFAEYAAPEAARWLGAALRAACVAPPPAQRSQVAVNVTVPVIPPDEAALHVHYSGGCSTAKVKVADPRSSLREDCARIEAVADALCSTVGEKARIRVDANGVWDVDTALTSIRELDRAARLIGGLEYVEQPCASVEELAEVRRRCNVKIAADESIRRAEDPLKVAQLDAADVAVIKVAPLGGIDRALDIARNTGLDVVVSSAVETSIGISMGITAAASLDEAPYASGLATVQLLTDDVTADSLLPTNGEIRVKPIVPERLTTSELLSLEVLAAWQSRLEDMSHVVVSSAL